MNSSAMLCTWYTRNFFRRASRAHDEVFPAAEVSALDKVVGLLPPPAGGGVQLEGPQKVGGVLEVGPDGDDLVDEVLDADNAELAQLLLDDVVGGDGRPVAVHLNEPTLVDQLAHRLQVGGSSSDEGLANPQHVDGGLVQLDEDTVVDLPQPEELEGLLDLGGDLVDTTNTDDEGVLVLSLDMVAALLLGLADQTDVLALDLAVLLGVLLGPLEDVCALLLAGGALDQGGLLTLGAGSGLPLPALQDRLWDGRKFLVWHSEKSLRR